MIYLDNAATTFPKPSCVIEEISKCIKQYCGNPGRSAHKMSMKSAEKIFETRVLLAELFNGSPENVVFTYNTTYALNIAIKSLIRPNTHVLISDIEHNSVLRPINQLCKQNICSFDIFNTDGTKEDILTSIKNNCKHNTHMLVCTHISNIGCRRLPIYEIGRFCKENNIIFILDAAQSAGIEEIDVVRNNVSALCLPAHKGLYGPQGLGIIIYNTENSLQSIIEGGTGINSKEINMPDFLPEMFEAGTLSTPSIAGLCEALKWIKQIGINKIKNHEYDLYMLLKNLLDNNENIIPLYMNNYPGNTLLFNVKDMSPSRVSALLDENNICVRSGFHCSPLAHKKFATDNLGAVRVSFGIFNTRNDVYQLIDILNHNIKAKK